jgi:hypothetical protein
VRLDWSERELIATVSGTWPRARAEGEEEAASSEAARSSEMPPMLLAMMEETRSQDRETRTASRSLLPDRIAEMAGRARALGLGFTVRDEGQSIELVAPRRRKS